MTAEGLGRYVKELRERQGRTLTSLAADAGLSKSELSALESGKIKLPTADKRRRLARALGVSHLDLLIAAEVLSEDEAGRRPIGTEPNPNRGRVLGRLDGLLLDNDQTEHLLGLIDILRRQQARAASQGSTGR